MTSDTKKPREFWINLKIAEIYFLDKREADDILVIEKSEYDKLYQDFLKLDNEAWEYRLSFESMKKVEVELKASVELEVGRKMWQATKIHELLGKVVELRAQCEKLAAALKQFESAFEIDVKALSEYEEWKLGTSSSNKGKK